MQHGFAFSVGVIVFAFLIAGAVAAWIVFGTTQEAKSVQSLADLPAAIGEWSASEETETYDSETIYAYINGHAEVYLAYGMRRCLARRYKGPSGESDLVLDIFELSLPEDAYGVFTHDTDGEAAGIGDGSLYRYGWLSFWQGRFFVSIVAETESERSRQAVHDLAELISVRLPPVGSPLPEILSGLPTVDRESNSPRFLHHPQILNTHFYVGEENPFQLGPTTPAALATYRRGESIAHLLLVDYPSPAAAESAQSEVRKQFQQPIESTDPVETATGEWQGTRRIGQRLAAVLAATDREIASSLLDDTATAAEDRNR